MKLAAAILAMLLAWNAPRNLSECGPVTYRVIQDGKTVADGVTATQCVVAFPAGKAKTVLRVAALGQGGVSAKSKALTVRRGQVVVIR